MPYDPTNPLIVQGDRTILVEVDNPRYAEARDALAPFAELEKSPEHIHTYRLTPLSLWNAAAAGHDAPRRWSRCCGSYSKFPLPANLAADIAETRQPLWPGPAATSTTSEPASWSAADGRCWRSWPASRRCADYLGERLDAGPASSSTGASRRAQAGADRVGYPAEDLAGYTEGAALPIAACATSRAAACRSTSATTSARPPTSSTPAATSAAAAASSCCPAAPARPSSASPPWR